MKKIKKEAPLSTQSTILKRDRPQVTFDFSQLVEYSYTKAEDVEFFTKLLHHLKAYSALTWPEIETNGKHKMGCEVLKSSVLATKAIGKLPHDIGKIYMLRATSGNQVLCGTRIGNTFQVYFIEYKHGDISTHGHKQK